MKRMISMLTAAALMVSAVPVTMASAKSELEKTASTQSIANSIISTNTYKSNDNNNPISSEIFCADPTAVEYNGRLYVYGTNDHQQYLAKGADKDNTYECIKSLVVFSTDDMVNWTYHGEIYVNKSAKYIRNSWAPSIVSRVEEDGLTHFYMYFSNNGTGVGVITATDPLGPWTDPLGHTIVKNRTRANGVMLTDCPNPFDPGVIIDDKGDAYLTFGGGVADGHTDAMPGSARIVKLGKDMISFDSEFKEIPAPYFFEASELNYINGTYVYTYNTNWVERTEWDYDVDAPSTCSMVYMTSKTPLDPDSWELKGEVFQNPGTAGLEYANNHTHMHKFKGKWYMFHHTLELKGAMGIKGGYRSLGVEEVEVDEQSLSIGLKGPTRKGVEPIAQADPYKAHLGAELHSTADIDYDTTQAAKPLVISEKAGSWTSIKNVDFGNNTQALTLLAQLRGKGRVEVRLDSPTGDLLTFAEIDSKDKFTDLYNDDVAQISGVHDLFFVYSAKDMTLRNWQFTKDIETLPDWYGDDGSVPEEKPEDTPEEKPAEQPEQTKPAETAKTSIKTAKAALSKTSYVYSGKAKKPTVKVVLGKKTLKKGTDYTVTYKNNVKVGKATVTIKGKGSYTGTISKTFKINPGKSAVSKLTSPKAKKLKVKYKKVSGVTGYQIKVSTSKKFTKSTTRTIAIKGAKNTSATVSKLKAGKKYYVKVRSYKTVSGKRYYSSYSKVKSIKVKK